MLYPINPNREVPWNNLPPLPLAEELFKNLEIYEVLVEAKAALARLHGRSVAVPNPAVLINTISLQEAKASSEIENIFTTDDELYKAFSENSLNNITGAPKEVLHYRKALWKGHEYMKEREQFDLDYFLTIYTEVKQTNDGFRPSFSRVYIKQGGSGPNAGKAIYTPPRGEGIIEEKLTNLLAFVNDDESYAVDPLLKMAIAHFQFEAIHPFRDGNGRTGRIFNINLLTKKGLLDYPILFLSKYIIQNKDQYYQTLAGVSQRADWRSWLIYMLKAVEATANISYNKINDILDSKEEILKAIQQQTDIQRPEQLVQMLFTQPYTKVKHFTEANIYAENTARNYLNKLAEIGVVTRKTIQGHHYYLNQELFRILSE